MTAYPTPANHDHWWLHTLTAGHRLHAVRDWPGCEHVWDQGTELAEYGAAEATSACGLTAPFIYAGVLSRFATARCAFCCSALGIARGNGTPVNESANVRLRACEATDA